MTTPAGWYDDGSGNLRWWDGQQWTAHVRAAAQPTADAVAEAVPTAAPESAGSPAAEYEPFAPPYALSSQSSSPGASTAPGYAAQSGYSAPSGYPGSAVYPGAPAAPAVAAPSRTISVLGLIGLVVVVVGVVVACIPPISIVGWVLLGLGFVASLVSLFLRGAKWPGITGLGVAVFGTILAVGVSLLSLGMVSTVQADPVPVATPSERPPADDDTTSEEDPSEIEGAEMVPFADLQVGDCIPLVEYDETDEIFELPVVPCDQPHTDEVFFIYQLDDGDYPGDDAINELAWDGCAAQFEGFVGLPYAESEFDIYNYTPTKASWTRMDDRTVHCIIYSYEDVTGSLRGAAR